MSENLGFKWSTDVITTVSLTMSIRACLLMCWVNENCWKMSFDKSNSNCILHGKNAIQVSADGFSSYAKICPGGKLMASFDQMIYENL